MSAATCAGRVVVGAAIWGLMSTAFSAEPASADTAASAVAVSSVAMPAVSNGPNWVLRVPKADPVAFHGVLNMDKAGGGPGGMAYPAVGGIVGLVAGVLTHSALSGAAQSAEKARLREQADTVLAAYQDKLQGFSHRELMQKAVVLTQMGDKKTVLASDDSAPSDWVIDSEPVFYMTQDEAALILENVVTITRPGDTKESTYHNTVRVVADPVSAADPKLLWGEDHAARLKAESEKLLAQSIDLALADARRGSGEPRPRKTVRYPEGKTEKMERGEVLDDCCGHMVVRTLRGWVLSVPIRQQPIATADKVTTQ